MVSGGSYGVARVTLGFFPGYMVGVMEVTQNVVFVAQAAVSFGNIVTVFTGLSSRLRDFLRDILLRHIAGSADCGRSYLLVRDHGHGGGFGLSPVDPHLRSNPSV